MLPDYVKYRQTKQKGSSHQMGKHPQKALYWLKLQAAMKHSVWTVVVMMSLIGYVLSKQMGSNMWPVYC